MLSLNRRYWHALAKQLQTLPLEQVRAKNEQLRRLYAEHRTQMIVSNCARWAEDEEEACDMDFGNKEAERQISATIRQLNDAKLDAYKTAHYMRRTKSIDLLNPDNLAASSMVMDTNLQILTWSFLYVLPVNQKIGLHHLLKIHMCKIVFGSQ